MEPGDVVVRASSPDALPAYVLRAVPGPDQVGCATLVEATRLARAYGRYAGVNAWVQNVDGSKPCLLVAHFRGGAGTGAHDGRSALRGRDGATTRAPAAAVRHAASAGFVRQ
jgi:hypothetical protein